MKIDDVRSRLLEHVTALEFDYKGVHGGVDPYTTTDFDVWYGKDTCVTVNSIDDVMNKKFFDGKSLSEILNDIENVDGL